MLQSYKATMLQCCCVTDQQEARLGAPESPSAGDLRSTSRDLPLVYQQQPAVQVWTSGMPRIPRWGPHITCTVASRRQ